MYPFLRICHLYDTPCAPLVSSMPDPFTGSRSYFCVNVFLVFSLYMVLMGQLKKTDQKARNYPK